MIVCLPVPCSSLFPASDSPQSNILSSPKAGRIAPSIQSLLPCTAPLKPLWVSIRASAISIVLPQWGHLPTATSQGLSYLWKNFSVLLTPRRSNNGKMGCFPHADKGLGPLPWNCFIFCDVSEKCTPFFSVIVYLFPTVTGLSPHVLICSLEVSDNKENCL